MNPESKDIQSPARLARLIELSRGIHHGIALGDAADQLTSDAPVRRNGVPTQLTLATTEGLIRTLERAGRGRGADWGHENPKALHRWGVAQRISGIGPVRGSASSLLTAIPAYGERRGSAPATVRALRHGPAMVSPAEHTSLGPHALVRTLPFAVLIALHARPSPNRSLTWRARPTVTRSRRRRPRPERCRTHGRHSWRVTCPRTTC